MRLDELSRPSPNQAVLALQDKGYEVLGRGLAGEVWAKPGSSTALKIFHKLDRAYLAFANMVMANPNEHFPRLTGKLIRLNEEHYAIRMERLEPISTDYSYYACAYIRANRWFPDEGEMRVPLECGAVFDRFPALQTACNLVITKLLPNYGLDLHSQNMMMRGDVPVITDPVAGTK